MIRVSALAPYPAAGPSTRFRLAQLREPLGQRGVELEVAPFVDDEAYRELYRPGVTRKGLLLLRGWGRRLRTLTGKGERDLWLVHRELAPLGNGLLQRLLSGTGAPWVYDFDDAVYLPSPGGHPLLRRLRAPEATTAALVRGAAAVLAGNEALARWARAHRPGAGDQEVHVVPTVVDTRRFAPAPAPSSVTDPPTLGWVGTHSTLHYLEALAPTLRALRVRIPFRLLVVSNRRPAWLEELGGDAAFRPWSEKEEVALTRALDVGLYPLPDDPWTRGKCGFKAIQYLACGVPTVASAVGVVPDIVVHGEGGFLVSPGGDWTAPLERLLRDAPLRERMGRRGRSRIEERYSVASVADRLAGILHRAAHPGRAPVDTASSPDTP